MTTIAQNQLSSLIQGTRSFLPEIAKAATTIAQTAAKVAPSVLRTVAAIGTMTGIAYAHSRHYQSPNFSVPALGAPIQYDLIPFLPDAVKLSLAQAYPGDPAIQKGCKDVVKRHQQAQIAKLTNTFLAQKAKLQNIFRGPIGGLAISMGWITLTLLEGVFATKLISPNVSNTLLPLMALQASWTGHLFLDRKVGEKADLLLNLISGQSLLMLALALRLRPETMLYFKPLLGELCRDAIKTSFLSAVIGGSCGLLASKSNSMALENLYIGIAALSAMVLGLRNSDVLQPMFRDMIAYLGRS